MLLTHYVGRQSSSGSGHWKHATAVVRAVHIQMHHVGSRSNSLVVAHVNNNNKKVLFQQSYHHYYSTTSRVDEMPVVIEPKLPPKYFIPKSERKSPTQVFQFDPKYPGRLAKSSWQAVEKELNYTPDAWLRHKDPWRKFRHLTYLLNSAAVKRLAPELAFTGSIAVALSFYNYVLMGGDVASELAFHPSAMAGATTAIGLLAGFRLNASYGRYDEGRKFWGEINNSARDLAGNALMWLHNDDRKDRMLKLIKAFPVAMNFHLNEKGGHQLLRRADPQFQDFKYAEYYAEMNDIYQDKTHDDFVQICNTYHRGGHVPLAITSIMRAIVAENKQYGVDPVYNREMDEQIQRWVACMGQCERVLRTPIPTSFTRHTSRLFFVWTNLLPFTLYSSLGPFGTLPGTLLVSYAVLGIADIGVQLEEPFNVLPLRQYSDGINDGVNSIAASYKASPTMITSTLTPSSSGVGATAAAAPVAV